MPNSVPNLGRRSFEGRQDLAMICRKSAFLSLIVSSHLPCIRARALCPAFAWAPITTGEAHSHRALIASMSADDTMRSIVPSRTICSDAPEPKGLSSLRHEIGILTLVTTPPSSS